MDSLVKVKYSDFSNSSIAQEIEFELIKDVCLNLKYKPEVNGVGICMFDAISDDTEIEGTLDLESLNVLIKSLVQFKNQIKAGVK